MSFSVSGLHAQKKETMKKRFREARTAIRTASGQENIERVLLDSIAQPTTTDKNEAEAYHMCALLQQSMNEALNMKAYLKQNLDTVKLYKTVLNIYSYTVKSDSVDDKRRFYSKNIKLRDLHRKNLLGGGKFLLRKSQWTEAYPFFDMFLKTCTTDMDSIVGRVAYWATVCGMNENNPYHVLEYVDKAIFLTQEEWDRIEDKALLDTEVVDAASDAFTDTTLKLNGISDGMISYSRVVKLLLQYYSTQNNLR
jgi:hypothetical protein